jgi:hypothetical protein
MSSSPATQPSEARRRVPGPHRFPRWARWVLLALALVVLGVLVFVAWLTWALSGGWDGLRPKAHADDRAVVTARGLAAAPLDDLTATVLAALDRSAATLPVELARVRTDDCHEGQNNWKVHSGFTLRCELADVVALRLETGSTGSQGAAPTSERLGSLQVVAEQLNDELLREGWTEAYVDSGLHVSRSGGLGLKGYYSRPTSSLRGAAADHAGSSLGLEIDVYSGRPPDYDLPEPAGTALGETRRVEGDLGRLRAVMTERSAGSDGASGRSTPRLLVHVSLPYFED